MSSTSTCRVCSAPSKLRCSICKRARYCSKDCQKTAWKSGHKTYCPQEAQCRPCVACGKMTVIWCSGCEATFQETVPSGVVRLGRAHCNKCDKANGVCPVCIRNGLSPSADEDFFNLPCPLDRYSGSA